MTGARLLSGVAVLACGAAPPRSAAEVDTTRIVEADREPGNWLTHGRTYGEQRFSPLEAINARTVGRLGLAWTYALVCREAPKRPRARGRCAGAR